MKTILAPVDFSSVTEAVIEAAQLLAQATHARILILTIVQPPVITGDLAMLEDISEIIAASEKTAARQLKRLAQRIETPALQVETICLTGSPAGLILEQANKSDADYLVMGSHGHTALYDLLLGSTTHEVLRQARCPVMIVPPPIKKAEQRKTR